MTGNTIEYLIRLKDDFTANMQSAASVGQKGGAAIAQGMAVAVAAGIKFKDEIGAGWEVLNGNYEKLGTVLGALPGPIGVVGEVVGSTIGKMIAEIEQAAEGYRKLSNATGASVEFLSGFKEAADDVRVSSEAVDSALSKFARGLGGIKDVTDGVAESGKGVAGTLRDLGIAAGDGEGHIRPLASLLPDIADAFSKMADGPQKTAIAIQLFGKQGAELIPILNKGRDGLNEMMEAAKAAGLTMSGETVAAVNNLKEAQDSLGDAWTSLGRKIGTAVIPPLADFVHMLNLAATGSDKVAQAQRLADIAVMQMTSNGKLLDRTIGEIKGGGDDLVKAFAHYVDIADQTNAKWGIFGKVSNDAIANMREMYPEIFKVSESTDKAAVSAETLAEAQKKVAEGSVEYKDRTQQLTEAMSKRDDQLADIQKKEELLIQAHEKGSITSEQYAKGMAYLQDQTGKVRDTFDAASGKIKDGAEATEKMDKAAQGAAQRQHDFEQAMKDAATASEGLKEKLGNLTDGIGGTPEKLDRAKRALIGFQLATGQLTQDQFEQKAIGELLTQQYVKGATTYEKFLENATKYYRGEISGAQALENVGATRNAFAVGYVKDMRAIETASGTAQGSELAFFDTLRVAGGSYKVYTSDAKNLAQAQIQHADAVSGIEKNQKLLNEAEKNGTISKLQNAEAQVYLNQQLGVVNENLRKSEKAYNNGQPVVKSWAKVISESGQSVAEWEAQMAKAGLTTEQVKQVVSEVSGKTVKISGDTSGLDDPKKEVEQLKQNAEKGATVTVTGNTAGLTEPVNQARSDAEKPITVPVDFKLGASPSFGVDKPATPSMTLPVSFDTAGLDKQAAAVKDQLTKLGPAGVSVSLDTISFDQTLLRVKSDLALIPDKSVAISINVPSSVSLPDFSGLTGKNVSLTSDISDILTDIGAAQKAVDGLSGKTAYLLADYSDVTKSVDVAQKAIDGLTGKTVDLKLTTSGSVALPASSSIAVSVTGDTADAATKIKGIIDTVIPSKTLYIYGNIDDAQLAMDDVDKDAVAAKTLAIYGANKAAGAAVAGLSTAASNPFALDAIDAVNAADIPLKTAVIAGNNQHVMQAINNTKTALEGIKDKTVYINVVRRDVSGDENGSGSPDDRGNSTKPITQGGLGSGAGNNTKSIVLTNTFYLKDDELTIATIKRITRETLAEVLNR